MKGNSSCQPKSENKNLFKKNVYGILVTSQKLQKGHLEIVQKVMLRNKIFS